MSISSFEVAAIFGLKDEATAVLQRIAKEAQALNKELKALAEQGVKLSTSFATSFAKMDTGVTASIGEVKKLTEQWVAADAAMARAAATAAKTAPIFSPGGAGGGPRIPGTPSGNRHGGGGPNFQPSAVPVPGGHIHGSGTAMVGAAAAGYSIWEALKLNDVVSKGLANVYSGETSANLAPQAHELTKAIIKEARITKLPLGVISKMALDEIKTNANQPWAARMRMLPLVIESAAREAYIKDTDPEAATKAFVGQLHQIRAFTPTEVEKYGPMIAYFAAKDPNSIVNIAKSGGYHTPIATSLMGIPVEQDLAAQTILDRTGVGGKSGTWLREIATRAAKPVHDIFYKGKVKILKDWGLMTKDEHSTPWMTAGHFDEQKLLHILNKKLHGMPVEEKAGRLAQVFGKRGAMGIALLTEDKMLKQYDEVLSEARAVMPSADFWAQQNATNPAQRMKGAGVELQIAALAGGKILAPLAVGAATAASSTLGWAAGLLPAPSSKGEKRGEMMGAYGLGGVLLGGVLGIPGGPFGIAAGAVLGGSIAGEVGYLAGAFKSLGDAAVGAAKALMSGAAKGSGADPTAPKKMNFIPPPSKGQPIILSSSLNIDGKTLAETLSNEQAKAGEFSTQAAYADPLQSAWGPDAQTVGN